MNLTEIQLPWLADASLRLALVLAAFLLLRPALRRFAGSAWLNALWLVLLARLLAPWPLATPFGWENSAPTAAPAAVEKAGDYLVRTRVEENTAPLAAPATVAQTATARLGWQHVWLAGFSAGLVLLATRAWRTRRLARQTEPARDARLLRVFADIPEAWRRGVELRETDALSVPTLAGLVRPAIWLPRAWLAPLSDAELRHVLLHELGHARRRDLLVESLFALAVCVHWFNPLAWLAARAARADREMACDAWVLARTEKDAAEEYGATLLKTIALLREPLRLAPHAVAMAASKRGLFTRIATLGAFRAQPAWRGVLGLLALAALLAVLTTTRIGAQTPPALSKPAIDQAIFGGGPAPVKAPPASGAPAAVSPVPLPPASVGMGAGGSGAQAPAGPRQIEIAARFVEITDSGMKILAPGDEVLAVLFGGKVTPSLGLAGLLPQEKYNALLDTLAKTAGVDLLSAPRVTTKSGQRAVIEIIREFRYPTEFDAAPALTPTAFETRNLGVTLEVEPTLGPDGHTIDLNLVPQIVELTGFNRVGPGGASTIVKVPAGPVGTAPAQAVTAGPGEILQPIFATRKVLTSVTVHDGQTIVLGGLRKQDEIDEKGQPREPRQLVIFITAKVITVEGTPTAWPVVIESKITRHRAGGASVLAAPKVAVVLGQSASVSVGEEKAPPQIEATFLPRLAGVGQIDLSTNLTLTDPDGPPRKLEQRVTLKLGEPASLRIGDLELSLTVTAPK